MISNNASEKGEFQSDSPEDTFAHARSMALKFSHSLVLIEGPMGAGKTLWAKGFADGLGLKRLVFSPTFTLMNHYSEGGHSLYHLDLYRINTLEELYDLGFFEILDAGWPCLVEWPERVPQIAKLPHLKVKLNFITDLPSTPKNTEKSPHSEKIIADCDTAASRRLITWAWHPQGA